MVLTRTSYFEQGGVTIYHGACVDVLAEMAPRSVGLIVTDPPYTESTHKGMRSNKGAGLVGRADCRTGGRRIDFASVTDAEVDAAFCGIARVCSRWTIATVAHQHAQHLESSPPDGLAFRRLGAWVKVAPAPQMSGTFPGQGWEAVAIMHATDGERMRWNGGGRSAVWHHRPEMRGKYPTQKPEPLIMDFLADFGEPGDIVCDPFMGSGTTLLCAWKRGHKVIGCDIREPACELAAKRIEAEMRQGRIFAPGESRPASAQVGFKL